MAEVAPFRALRYDLDKIENMGRVVTPPYDVINSEQQERFYSSSPHNVIRLELNRIRPEDDRENNRYTRAASHLQTWLDQGVLRPEPRPALYLCRTTYRDHRGHTRTRTGFFTLLRVEDFARGVVLPHEKTFTDHKEDRFQLTKATHANISPIFALYPDEENQVVQALEAACSADPALEFTDPLGLGQSLTVISDPEVHRRVIRLMADKRIYIADGHHRYETALNYRDYMRGQYPQAGPRAPWEYVLVYLCSMSDPGLTVFPCHRLVPQLGGFAARDFLLHAEPYFEHQALPLGPAGSEDLEALTAALARAGERNSSLGVVSAESDAFHLLTLKPGVMEKTFPEMPEPLRGLDVVVLTNLVLERILGFDDSYRDRVHTIEYLSDLKEVIGRVRSGRARTGFVLNPTRLEQVKAVAREGLIMPRKATYFYPKVLTGLVIYHMDSQG